ncbi:MAG: hypothetical protein EPO21_21625 [Chloroflexota bacterium]|nr:MAG: hypothetical protein EPO21_21625 [Chloroflexota bacterium]
MHAFSHVFGVRAGKHAAAVAKSGESRRATVSMADKTRERVAALQKGKGSLKPRDPLKVLKKTAWENLNAVRSRNGLTQMLGVIESIREDSIPYLGIENSKELIQALELQNLLKVGEIMASVDLMRTESRGSHYREDFPERDDANWACSIVSKKTDGKLGLSKVSVDEDWRHQPDDRGELAWNLWLKESSGQDK